MSDHETVKKKVFNEVCSNYTVQSLARTIFLLGRTPHQPVQYGLAFRARAVLEQYATPHRARRAPGSRADIIAQATFNFEAQQIVSA